MKTIYYKVPEYFQKQIFEISIPDVFSDSLTVEEFAPYYAEEAASNFCLRINRYEWREWQPSEPLEFVFYETKDGLEICRVNITPRIENKINFSCREVCVAELRGVA